MLALVTDLIFATKITSTAQSLGKTVKVVRSLDRLQARLAEGLDSVAIIDLDADGVDVIGAIKTCKSGSNSIRVIAYVSHIRADLITAARTAGADEVIARSAFVQRLSTVLNSE
jgi:DNA-binding NtrC family response regulator